MMRYTSTARSVPNTFTALASAGPSVLSATLWANFHVMSRMASSNAWHLARSCCTQATSIIFSPLAPPDGVTRHHVVTSSSKRSVRPDKAAKPTRSWLSCMVMSFQPPLI